MGYNELKEQIKSAPISSVIGHYISLNKKGANYEALCPFHTDSHPSLKVNDHKGLFKCFACDTAGDHISFVEKFKRIDFKDAIKEIAGILGYATDDLDKEFHNPKQDLGLRVLSVANKIYRKMVTEHNPEEFKQFITSRGLTIEVATQFSLGYAPKTNLLSQYLKTLPSAQQKDALKMAIEIGLIRKNETDADTFDTFRERILFPIWDQSGHVRGFGSRATQSYQKAKYLNSQESFIFNKRNILYGFHLAKNHIRERNQVILTEGYMDTITMHQFDFKNTVALMGIALSDYAINLLKPLASQFVLALDSDNAGLKAMEKINESLLEKGILAKYLDFKPHKDPDEFLHKEGRLLLQKRLEEAPMFLDVLIDKLIPENIPQVSDQKLLILNKVFQVLAPLKDNLSATERVISIAKRLNFQSSADSIQQSYVTFLNNINKLPSYQTPVIRPAEIERPTEARPENSAQPMTFQIQALEKSILTNAVLHPECLNHPKMTELLDFVSQDEVKNLIARIAKLYLEIEDSEYSSILQQFILNKEFALSLKETVSSALFQFKPIKMAPAKLDKFMIDLVKRSKIQKLKSAKTLLIQKQSQTYSQDESNQYMQQIIEIEKSLENIKNQLA